MPELEKLQDVSTDVAQAITKEAASWKGTPYQLAGPSSEKGVGGDCSGSTYKIYSVAQCPYDYQTAGGFPDYAIKSGLFRELAATESKQDGDILSWSSHMALYSTFALDSANGSTPRTTAKGFHWTQKNDMWTASHTDGPAYGAAEMRYWRSDAPRVFRYQK